jgi:acetyl esterase/lipase
VARQHDDYDDYEDEPRPRRKRKKQPQAGGGSLGLILGGVAAGVLLLCCGGCGFFIWWSTAAEDSTSPVPLRQARAGFQTKLIPNDFTPDGPAEPAPPGFRMVRYASPVGPLVAYVSEDRRDGRRRPAVVWAHGGFGGVGPDELVDGGTLDPFTKAGFVVMSPSWRGENDNPGKY